MVIGFSDAKLIRTLSHHKIAPWMFSSNEKKTGLRLFFPYIMIINSVYLETCAPMDRHT